MASWYDRDDNGTIDSGRELFGDSTPLTTGGNAANGFAALAQEDTNSDGKVDANDANFDQLRIWRDLNQDGLSQSNELSTLDSLNIAALNVASTANSQILPGGNRIADLAPSFAPMGRQVQPVTYLTWLISTLSMTRSIGNSPITFH